MHNSATLLSRVPAALHEQDLSFCKLLRFGPREDLKRGGGVDREHRARAIHHVGRPIPEGAWSNERGQQPQPNMVHVELCTLVRVGNHEMHSALWLLACGTELPYAGLDLRPQPGFSRNLLGDRPRRFGKSIDANQLLCVKRDTVRKRRKACSICLGRHHRPEHRHGGVVDKAGQARDVV